MLYVVICLKRIQYAQITSSSIKNSQKGEKIENVSFKCNLDRPVIQGDKNDKILFSS